MNSAFVNVETFANYCNKERLDTLSAKFSSSFSDKKVEFFCRAPGRVNLIGEHIDYCGYGVLPMAVGQDVMMAVGKNNDKKVRLINTLDKYEPYETDIDSIEISQEEPKWFHYFLCGYKGVLQKMGKDRSRKDMVDQCSGDEEKNIGDFGGGVEWGMDVLVDGCVPSCAGLSSSSALVCASALATMVMYLGEGAYTKLELAELCQQCEKYIGTEGGGMDQSIAFLAHEGKAKYVEFNPLRVTDVPVPEGVVFVIANSCVQLNKAATSHFNSRVVECRLAAQLMASKEGLEWKEVRKLADLQNILKLSLGQCFELVDKHLTKNAYWKGEVSSLLDVAEDELDEISLSPKTYELTEFKLRQRALHVFSESQRVLEFKSICERGMVGESEEIVGGSGEIVVGDLAVEGDGLVELGMLMNNSHQSCQEDYECSCDELDELVEFARIHGALGCRLTGAGWGGCCVMMVPLSHKGTILSALAKFYDKKGLSQDEVKEAFFATQPGNGASIIKLDACMGEV